MEFNAEMFENVPVGDSVQREARGIRNKKNYFALLALMATVSFEAFIVLHTSELPYLIINWILSFVIFVSGLYAISRIENYLRITTRPIFHTSENTDNQNKVNRRCNNCRTFFDEFPCPKCGQRDATLIAEINESISIPESKISVTSNFLTKTNLLGFGIFCILFMVQLYVSFWIGGMVSLTISILMGLLLFIPSYYLFVKRYFIDRENLI